MLLVLRVLRILCSLLHAQGSIWQQRPPCQGLLWRKQGKFCSNFRLEKRCVSTCMYTHRHTHTHTHSTHQPTQSLHPHVHQDTTATDAQMQHQRSIFQLATHLVQLARNSRLDQTSMIRYMQFLKEKYAGLQGRAKGAGSKEPATHPLPPESTVEVGSDILAPED